MKIHIIKNIGKSIYDISTILLLFTEIYLISNYVYPVFEFCDYGLMPIKYLSFFILTVLLYWWVSSKKTGGRGKKIAYWMALISGITYYLFTVFKIYSIYSIYGYIIIAGTVIFVIWCWWISRNKKFVAETDKYAKIAKCIDIILQILIWGGFIFFLSTKLYIRMS